MVEQLEKCAPYATVGYVGVHKFVKIRHKRKMNKMQFETKSGG